jgi:hypothetical protein
MDTLVEKISWHRRGVRSDFVGSLRANGDGIRLTGRDPRSGLDVVLSIPSLELSGVHVSSADGNGNGNGELYIVLELEHAQPIFLREVGGSSLHAQLLARKLGAVLPPRLLTQGG